MVNRRGKLRWWWIRRWGRILAVGVVTEGAEQNLGIYNSYQS
jgi:hypothetical protein